MTNVEMRVESMVRLAGLVAGAFGVILMVVSTVARLLGRFSLGGVGTGTLFLAGVGAVATGCFFLLWVLSERRG
jgi:hypothetical protein